MAIVACPECGKSISDKAVACPECGFNYAEYIKDIELQKEKQLKAQICKEKKENRSAKFKNFFYRLFGSRKKKILWSVGLIVYLTFVVFLCLHTNDYRKCKQYSNEMMERYHEIDGHLLDTEYEKYYAVDDLDLEILDIKISFVKSHLELCPEYQKQLLYNWFEKEYSITYDNLFEEIENSLELDGNIKSSNDYDNLIRKLRLKAKESYVPDLEIVDQSLTADGDYLYYKAKVQNNTNRTITYFKYNIYLYDTVGNNIDTDWSNWSGSLQSGAQVSIDTMLKRSSKDRVKYKVEFEDYK